MTNAGYDEVTGLRAMLQRERQRRDTRFAMYRERKVYEPVPDKHTQLTIRLNTVEMVCKASNVYEGWRVIEELTDLWSEEDLWDAAVLQELAAAARLPSSSAPPATMDTTGHCPCMLQLMVILFLANDLRASIVVRSFIQESQRA